MISTTDTLHILDLGTLDPYGMVSSNGKLGTQLQDLNWNQHAQSTSFNLGVSKSQGPLYEPQIVGNLLYRHPQTGPPVSRNSHVVPMIISTLNLPHVNPKPLWRLENVGYLDPLGMINWWRCFFVTTQDEMSAASMLQF